MTSEPDREGARNPRAEDLGRERRDAERTLAAVGLPIVHRTARRMSWRFGGRIDESELRSLGYQCLLDAVRSFDPARAEFGAYLYARLRWAMLGEARLFARQARLWRSGIDSGAVPTGGTPLSSSSWRFAHAQQHGDDSFTHEASSDQFDPEAQLENKRAHALLRESIAALPPASRELVVRHYFGGEAFNDLAREAGLSRPATCRMHLAAQQSLREQLEVALGT